MKRIRNRRELSANENDECTFTPQLCYSTAFANGNIDDFLERQKIYNEIKKDRLERKMSKSIENNQYTFKPKINLTSDFLVRSDPNRINENSIDKFETINSLNPCLLAHSNNRIWPMSVSKHFDLINGF